jgi:glycerol uptake facilitator-like aquaporin
VSEHTRALLAEIAGTFMFFVIGAGSIVTAAISAAVAHRDGSAFGIAARFSALSMMRGRTQLAVMPSRFVSSASDSVHRSSAAFAIA